MSAENAWRDLYAGDRREFRKTEARQEVEDALVYLACAWLRDQGGGQ